MTNPSGDDDPRDPDIWPWTLDEVRERIDWVSVFAVGGVFAGYAALGWLVLGVIVG